MAGFGAPPFGTQPFGGGPVPPLDFVFLDPFSYNGRNFRQQYLSRSLGSTVVIDPRFIFTATVPVLDFVFNDVNRYRAHAIAVGALTRRSYIADASWWQNFIVLPAMDWIFYDSQPYRRNQTQRLAQDRAGRNWIADSAQSQNFIFTAPSFDYHFYDRNPYRTLATRRVLAFPRNFVADSWIPFAAGFPPISTDWMFNDSHPYRNLADQRRQQRFNRNYLADFPAQANLVPPFVAPDGWLPSTSPVARPVRQRQSFWVIGVPGDIAGNTVSLASWQPTIAPLDQRYRLRRTLESIFPNINPSIPPPPPPPSFNPASIVGALFTVCVERRTFLGVKYNSANVCQEIRIYAVPANTAQLCQTFLKDPQAVLDYSIDWSAPLQSSGDTILTSSWSAAVGLTVVSSSYVGNVATVFLLGGVDQTHYTATNTVTTAGGRTLAQDLVISVVLQ